MIEETGLWFGSARRRRFGWLSVPADHRAELGVVLCPPVGEEARASHRTFRRFGLQLAERGALALRVDYDGTGDSVGLQDDPERVEAWLASIADAVTQLREYGVARVALVGMRLGATLVATLAERLSDDPTPALDSLVLWDPCLSGRAFLREGAAVHAMANPQVTELTVGAVHTPGFGYSAAVAADLERLNLAGLSGAPWTRRTLVLTRNGNPLTGRAGRALAGANIQWDRADGQQELLGVEPNLAQVPNAPLARIVAWLTDASSDPASRRTDERPVERPPLRGGIVRDTVFDRPEGVSLRERIVGLGPLGLFAVTTEPAAGADTPWIVLVNVAAESHIGPGRRWVEYARDWASLGFRCVRFDQSGLGNSPTGTDQREDLVFDPHWLDDLPAVIDALGEHTAAGVTPAPIAIFGLCSGAYSAFEAAVRRPVDAVYAVNPRVSLPEMSRVGDVYDTRRAVARPLASPFALLAARHSRAAWGLWRIFRQFTVWNAPMASVMQVLKSGTAVQIVANRKDAAGFREVAWWSVVRRRAVGRTQRYGIAVHGDVDHAMMNQIAQDVVGEHATAFFSNRYAAQLDQLQLDRSLHVRSTPPTPLHLDRSEASGHAILY